MNSSDLACAWPHMVVVGTQRQRSARRAVPPSIVPAWMVLSMAAMHRRTPKTLTPSEMRWEIT